MRTFTLQPASMLAGAALASAAFLTMAQKPAPENIAYEFQILIDVEEEEATAASAKGWEFVGFLGQSTKGVGTDETLWRRPE